MAISDLAPETLILKKAAIQETGELRPAVWHRPNRLGFRRASALRLPNPVATSMDATQNVERQGGRCGVDG